MGRDGTYLCPSVAAGGTKSLHKSQELAGPLQRFLVLMGTNTILKGGRKNLHGDLKLPTTQKTVSKPPPVSKNLPPTAVPKSLQHAFEWLLYNICNYMQYSNKGYFHRVNKVNRF